MTRLRYAVVPTRDRPGDFADCARALQPQIDVLIAVAHGDPAWEYASTTIDGLGLTQTAWQIAYDEDPPNISRMWNLGLDAAHSLARGRPYDVAVLNDDVIVPPDWFNRVTAAMSTARLVRSAAGCVQRERDLRMTGYAFILNGDAGLRADEQFQWWYGDDDLERQALAVGGVAFALGQDVEHRHPNSTTVGVLADIAREDGIRFQAKWKRNG